MLHEQILETNLIQKMHKKNLIKLFSKKRLDPRRTGTMTIQT